MKYKLIYILLISCLHVFAQSAEEAERLFNDKQYVEAGEIYGALLKKNPKNALNNYRYARCCYESGNIEPAIKHFELSGERYALKNYYLGELYSMVYEFQKSIDAYKKYVKTLKPNDERIAGIEKKIKQAEQAARMLSRVEDIAIIDSMVVDKEDFLNYYRFSSELGSLKQERLKLNEEESIDKITYTTQRQDRMYFSDSIEGKMNIFTSYRLLDGWSTPVLLPDIINSDTNVNYPFLLLDGVTMYFASEGENSIGGYDIFITKYMPAINSYLTPENIGMPFNSPFNDYMLVIDEINNTGWFATDRYQQKDKVCLYFFVPNESKIIVRSEDMNHIRETAQLKTFREADISGLSKPAKTEIKPENNEDKIEFIITDNVIYTHPEQFKSKEALKAWTELNELRAQALNMKEQLETLRHEYSKAETEADRSLITPKILVLEKKIHEQDEIISQKTLTIRNEEIKHLK